MIRKYRILYVVTCSFSIAGCASIVDGTSQQIGFISNPPGANCTLFREGQVLGSLTAPGSILVKKNKHDITVECSKDGFELSTTHLKSEIQDSTWGNIILGGGIGWAIDSASGADNKYQSHVTVSLIPKTAVIANVDEAEAVPADEPVSVSAHKQTKPVAADPAAAQESTSANGAPEVEILSQSDEEPSMETPDSGSAIESAGNHGSQGSEISD